MQQPQQPKKNTPNPLANSAEQTVKKLTQAMPHPIQQIKQVAANPNIPTVTIDAEGNFTSSEQTEQGKA